jgi:hypothetical protein
MQNKNSRASKVKTHDEFSIFNSTVCILDIDTQQDRRAFGFTLSGCHCWFSRGGMTSTLTLRLTHCTHNIRTDTNKTFQ